MRIVTLMTSTTLALISPMFATSVQEKSLKELVSLSANAWGGKVVSVRMEDEHGRNVTDPEAMTGPGLKNTIYLDVAVDASRILKSSHAKIPEKISIPLWQKWHYSLGQIKEAEGYEAIFLLTANLEPVYPSGFQRPLEEERAIKRLIDDPDGKAGPVQKSAHPGKP